MIQDYQAICLSVNDSLMNAFKKMDTTGGKLLIILSDEATFLGLLSAGDIQRYILSTGTLKGKISDAMRKNILVSKEGDKLNDIKSIMVKYRMEFMPVINDSNKVIKVHFWKDFFDLNQQVVSTDKSLQDIPIVIMAGGQGTRLKPLTNIIPKPLIPIGDTPIVQMIMDKIHLYGASNFYLSINYKSEMIKQYLNAANLPYNLNYFKEDKPLGTAGSLFLLKDKLKTTFIVSNCDILIDQNLDEIMAYHQEQRNELTAVAVVKSLKIPYGTMEFIKDGALTELKEKPEFTYFINSGVYILEPELLNEVPNNEFFHITHLIQKILDRKGKVGVFPVSEGSWYDIGEWDKYEETKKRLNVN